MTMDEEIFTEVPWDLTIQVLLDSLLRARRDLYVDPMLNDPWVCDPRRCRPLLGPNLCCKVERRCPHLRDDACAIHKLKPFGCALFPLDLIRVGGIRVVTTVKNPEFFATGWCRYDRDMLRCFDGEQRTTRTMFGAQRPVLERVFTRAEVVLLERRLRKAGEGDPPLAAGAGAGS